MVPNGVSTSARGKGGGGRVFSGKDGSPARGCGSGSHFVLHVFADATVEIGGRGGGGEEERKVCTRLSQLAVVI